MEAMTSESPRVLGEATLAELRTRMLGSVISPGDSGYENARRIWNGAIDLHPALVLRCSGVADVINGVQFACSEGLTVAIRGGRTALPGSPPATDDRREHRVRRGRGRRRSRAGCAVAARLTWPATTRQRAAIFARGKVQAIMAAAQKRRTSWPPDGANSAT